jgi:hypothetical protein
VDIGYMPLHLLNTHDLQVLHGLAEAQQRAADGG